MLIDDIILEIKSFKTLSPHKAAMDIFKLLEGNKDLFLAKMNPDNFNYMLNGFENMSYGNPKEYQTPGYAREFKTLYDLLLFYMDRIN